MLGWTFLRDSEVLLNQKLADMRLAAHVAELDAVKQLSETRIASLLTELQAARAYTAKCEALIAHERERIDSERERADRLADTVLQSNGLAPTSTTVRQEQAAAEEVSAVKRTSYMQELMEIYGETEGELLEDGETEPLPEPIAETLAK